MRIAVGHGRAFEAVTGVNLIVGDDTPASVQPSCFDPVRRETARAHEGVAEVYAMQAGRQVRVMVPPEVVDDLGAGLIAREVARRVSGEPTHPGQIRVTVVRESRVTEVAR
ncbi:hypothetical protein PUR71_03310 [Streptomyces sp. SP17BM10]|uniref:hypothetical protein n=1 Tax=Streptomyces sp. SP17BM10 TaxID=3002530 RepID=UPI002E7993A9|nr:hypothetical protein [Streptomyces sp. SP17BM10]MEE1781964.1 hypothetical protein [Streptomyces sp. SP17BM10]